MSGLGAEVDRFRELCRDKLAFLKDSGFRESPADGETTPTFASVVYVGRNVGLVFSLDRRDNTVDAQIARLEAGRLPGPGSPGSTVGLMSYLVKHCGYRGRLPPELRDAAPGATSHALSAALDRWAGVLRAGGASLLKDEPIDPSA
jgi:hypothetical protein